MHAASAALKNQFDQDLGQDLQSICAQHTLLPEETLHTIL